MTRIVTRAAYSAGQDALENFDTLATYAADGAKKAKRRVLDSGHKVTVIKDGCVVEVMPGGGIKAVGNVATADRFKPLVVG